MKALAAMEASGAQGANMFSAKDIGKRVKEIRLAKDLTQDQITAKAKVSQTYLSRVENGRVYPTLPSLYKIVVEGLDTKFYEFFLPLDKQEPIPEPQPVVLPTVIDTVLVDPKDQPIRGSHATTKEVCASTPVKDDDTGF